MNKQLLSHIETVLDEAYYSLDEWVPANDDDEESRENRLESCRAVYQYLNQTLHRPDGTVEPDIRGGICFHANTISEFVADYGPPGDAPVDMVVVCTDCMQELDDNPEIEPPPVSWYERDEMWP